FIIITSGIISNFLLSLISSDIVFAGKELLYAVVIDLIMCVFMMFFFGAYSRLWRNFNIRDYVSCIISMGIGFALAEVVMLIFEIRQNIVFLITYFLVATVGVCLFRFIFRKTFLDLTKAGREEGIFERTLIVGAGRAGQMILQEILNSRNDLNNPSHNILPVCFADDDVSKLRTKINGVSVLGTCPEIPRICADYQISNIIVAIPSCEEDEKRKILDYCSATECKIKVIPYISELLFDDKNKPLISQAKEIRIEDLLGRK
ncbi:MAG TPA: polysaccharide biosynthesis protein, partial [Ruminococcus sp.]|nr:polysaccharide biosynthesis protein [Ruminococcus sp.]